MSCSKTMAFRMVEIGQQYVFQECNKNNRKDKFEQHLLDKLAQHCCTTAARMLQVSKVVALTS